jgi:hypothetical protein
MRKHIFGLAIFTFIIGSFALIYAFFNAPPIPQIPEVKPFAAETQPAFSCRKKQQEIDYEVQNVQFDFNSNKLISNVKLIWKGAGEPPKNVYVSPQIFTLDNSANSVFLNTEQFLNPFEKGRSGNVTFTSNVEQIGSANNLYVIYSISRDYTNIPFVNKNEKIAKAKQVLFVHGNSSIIKK